MRKIVKVLFTWSWQGFVVEYDNGERDTLAPKNLLDNVGESGYSQLMGHAKQLYGHWREVNPPVVSK